MSDNNILYLSSFADYAVKFAQKIGASWVESRVETSSGTGFGMDNGVLTSSGFDDVSGMNVRFIINGSQGFISTNKFDKKHISNLIKRNLDSVRYSASTVKERINLSDEKVYKKNYHVRQLINSKNVSEKDKIELLSDLHKQLSSLKIPASSTSLSIQDSFNEKYYVNSDGAKIISHLPYLEMFYMFTVNAKGRSAQRFNTYGATAGWEALKKWKIQSLLTNEVNALGDNVANATKVPMRNTNVVVGAEITGIMVHESVGHPFEADRVLGREMAQAGGSFIKPNMMGSDVASDIVTLIDDPRIKNSAGFYLYDDEGVKARKRILIKNGKINELYHNRETAFAFGIKSNGASRSVAYNNEPIVRMANTFVKPGKTKMRDLIKDAKDGVYIKNFMEWNIDDRRTNFKAVGNEAYLIKDGALAGPIWRPTIEISADKLWKSVTAVGNKKTFYHTTGNCGKGEPMQGIPVFFSGPAMLLKGVNV